VVHRRTLEQFGAEARANLLRILGVGGFYLIEMLTYHGLRLGGLIVPPLADTSRDFHLAATALAVAWVAMPCSCCCCSGTNLPQSLPYLSTAGDITLLTSLTAIGRRAAQAHWLSDIFFLLALAATRFDLRLLWFALQVPGRLSRGVGLREVVAKRDIIGRPAFGIDLRVGPAANGRRAGPMNPPACDRSPTNTPANGSCGRTSMTITHRISGSKSLRTVRGPLVGLDDQYCWLLRPGWERPAGSCHRRRRRRKPKTIGRFSLSTLFLIVTRVHLPGTVRHGAGLGILLTVRAARASASCGRRTPALQRGKAVSLGDKAIALVSSVGVVLLVACSAFAAFFVTCLTVWLCGDGDRCGCVTG